MSEFENTPIMMFSQTTKKRRHRSSSQKLARKQDRENSLNLARVSLENIMAVYEDFSRAYKNNNLYGLFNASEGFYNNAIDFITHSTHLYKHKLISLRDTDSSTIIENMNTLLIMIEQLNTERTTWLSESDILDDHKFARAVEEGSNRIDLLKDNINNFLNRFSGTIENEKDKLQGNNKNH